MPVPSWYRRGSSTRPARAGVRSLTSVLLPAILLAAAACSDAPTSAPAGPSAVAPTRAVTVAAAGNLLECASAPASSVTRLITPAGGFVATGGHAIAIPRGAVAKPVRITMSVPASRFVEVDISAEGSAHYQFRRPVVVTLDYSRCGASADDLTSMTAWYVDRSTLGFLADMGGIDDRYFRRIVFTTDHLSGYAVAYRGNGHPPQSNQEQ